MKIMCISYDEILRIFRGGGSVVILTVLVLLLASCNQQSDTAASIPDGWEGNAGYFADVNGVIVAGDSLSAIPRNEFLCTETTYSDFELTLSAMLTGEGTNAGVQIRSHRIPDHHEVIGYQCDIGFSTERPIWGSLYDESRRRRFLAHPPTDSISVYLKPDGWNDLRIRAEGDTLQIWLNGFQTVHYIESDEDINQSGCICLQIHSGPPAIARYKNIRILPL